MHGMQGEALKRLLAFKFAAETAGLIPGSPSLVSGVTTVDGDLSSA
jgi:hypothetical protein